MGKQSWGRLFITLSLFLFTHVLCAAPNWGNVERLLKEQKLSQATQQVSIFLKTAKKNKDNKTWQQALILGASLKSQRGEFENAVKYLNQPWPQDNDSLMLINLYKANLLTNYLQSYRWEIQGREKISTKKWLPLKKRTMEQLVQEINQSFAKAYTYAVKQDQPLERFTLPLPSLKNYFIKPDYPKNVRGNSRDTITYLWSDFLQDTSLWTPKQLAQSRRFNLKELLAITYRNNLGFSAKAHPVKRSLWLLSDLEHYQQTQKKPEAAMEAFRVKINKLARSRSDKGELNQLITILKQRIAKSNRALPWINMLHNTLARLIRQTETDDANVQSVAVLKQCVAQHKKHRATSFCQNQLEEITRPYIQMIGMKSDGLKKRSLEVSHKNIQKLYFRAWRMSLQQAMEYNLYREVEGLLKRKTRNADLEWQVSLPPSRDYKIHKTYLTPPINQYGYWVVVASAQPDFSTNNNKNLITSVGLNLTKLVATAQGNSKAVTVTVFNGETGRVASKVRTELWARGNNRPARLFKAGITSNEGKVDFKGMNQSNFSLVLKYQNDFTLIDNFYTYQRDMNGATKSALIFTDRAIYRPSQKILWKAVAYHGDRNTNKYSIFPNSQGWVKLLDANGKLVKKVMVKTNQFGSASGEFVAKPGLLLGNWRMTTSWGGYQSIKVEEYKRPTFTVKIEAGDRSLGLNRAARVSGSAKYYFGQAVTNARVKWRVKRQVLNLWEYGGRGQVKGETIASGTSPIAKNGKFYINFTPKSLTPSQLKGTDKYPTQTYLVSAELTDSGGETRKASRSFIIGKLGISADISAEKAFGVAGKNYQLSVSRHDLNGTPRKGNAFWELFSLKQPKSPVLPTDIPVKNTSKYATQGDKMKPRWERASASLSEVIKDWKNGPKVKQGALRHDTSGEATLSLQGVQAGLYRLKYTSKDQWGQAFTSNRVIVIAKPQKNVVESPSILMAQENSVEVGKKVKLLVGSGFKNATTLLEVYHKNRLLRRSIQTGGIKQLEFPVQEAHRGGLSFVLTMVKDYQLIRKQQFVSVPWSNKELNVSFSTFRDKLQPGQKEKWRITVKNAKNQTLGKGAAEVLASMYDRSLDLFAKQYPASVASLYSQRSLSLNRADNLGTGNTFYSKSIYINSHSMAYQKASLRLSAYGSFAEADMMVATPAPVAAGMVARPVPRKAMAPPRAAPVNVQALQMKRKAGASTESAYEGKQITEKITDDPIELGDVKVRTNFNETAFFYPHLLLGEDGSVAFEFEVPESLTQWKVWVSALTKDLSGGSVTKFARTSKELMVRPYLPRFLRSGDRAFIDVLVNNAGDKPLSGKLDFDVLDPITLKSVANDFKLVNNKQSFKVAVGKSSKLRFSIIAPKELGMVAIRARASASNGKQSFGDGEQRPMPVLPSRIHLTQSRFTALQGNMSKQLQFKELASNVDRTRINDRLVVTVDGQLFYSTLNALPYLTNYPYECTEQTMNRFLSSSIVNSVFKQHPAIATMAKKLAKRKTQYEKWEAVDKDPNRKMLLEETPWLEDAKGGTDDASKLIAILDPKIAKKNYRSALTKLRKAQASDGGFPWWEGGRASPYMTAYLLHGFSRAIEFKVDIPKDMVKKAWRYMSKHYKKNLQKKPKNHLTEITLINYVISAYPNASWTGGVFSANDKKRMLDLSFKHWTKLSPLLKAYLALTLNRAGRHQQATLVFDSLMDAAKTDPELGTYWAPEDRSWLWYNDRVDTHAFMLRSMMELNPTDKRRHGLVQWLMLNKKLNHWKSTRATAESIYALVHYLKQENQLGIEERATIKIGNHLNKTLIFKPTEYTGAKNQTMVKGNNIKPDMANIVVANHSKSLMFASATWHFSTEKLPKNPNGDFFNVKRTFFKRVHKGNNWQLQPLQEGATLKVGDQLEVQLSLRSKHNAEFVHLRAPRGAGFEPESGTSGYRWNSGIGYYEEIRDSGANYFFDRLPAGQYTFKYRLRATTAGQFRVAPATVQSVYAPEFNAYSSGKRLNIR